MKASYYNPFAGNNTDLSATAVKDCHGNLAGSQYDLAKDGAFKGQSIVVFDLEKVHFCDFSLARKALEEKGFSVIFWQKYMPSLAEFEKTISTASQLWILSGGEQRLNGNYLKIITDFFNRGRGLFLWGDNEPFFKDANYVSKYLFNTTMSGNLKGCKKVTLQKNAAFTPAGTFKYWLLNFIGIEARKRSGIVRNHPITTGLEFLYEGHTVATIERNRELTPIMYGSAGNLITACYDKDGKRAIIDGGFTRVYPIYWDTAGTARFVKNAAAWLANLED